MNSRYDKVTMTALGTIACLVLASCGNSQNLWHREFTKAPQSSAPADIKGYWEGSVAMGAVRTRIEAGRITIALKCDDAGKIVSQGTATIAFESEGPARMVLLEDMVSDKDEKCGFRFYKGNEFRYRLSEAGVLELNFAGASIADLKRLGD